MGIQTYLLNLIWDKHVPITSSVLLSEVVVVQKAAGVAVDTAFLEVVLRPELYYAFRPLTALYASSVANQELGTS